MRSLILLSLVALALAQRAPEQYHIQTDQGPDRFFRFQTDSGQYRKEERHADGSVTGSYGWVDPNGILRLFDYVSDAGGYRIERQRLFKVGNSAAGRSSVGSDCQSSPELCFEVYPLDLDSDPSFTGSRLEPGPSGPRQLHIVDGGFRSTGSFLVSSLTSNSDPANPISRQNQATFFESDLPRVPPPAPKVVIGAAASPPEPEVRSKPFVIGAAAGPVDSSAPRSSPRSNDDAGVVIGVVRGSSSSSPRSFDLHPNFRNSGSDSSNGRSGVVIGLRNDRRKK